MNPDFPARLASFFVGNDDLSQDEGAQKAAEIIRPLLDDSARLQWLAENLEGFFGSSAHVVAKFDGLRVAIDAARNHQS